MTPYDDPPGRETNVLRLTNILREAKLGPIGVESVLDFFRASPVFEMFRNQFTSASFAFLSAGLRNDSAHNWPQTLFHPMYHDARKSSATRYEAQQAERRKFKEGFLTSIIDMVRSNVLFLHMNTD